MFAQQRSARAARPGPAPRHPRAIAAGRSRRAAAAAAADTCSRRAQAEGSGGEPDQLRGHDR